MTPWRAPSELRSKRLIAPCLCLDGTCPWSKLLASSLLSPSPGSAGFPCSPGTQGHPRSPAGWPLTSTAFPCVLGQIPKRRSLQVRSHCPGPGGQGDPTGPAGAIPVGRTDSITDEPEQRQDGLSIEISVLGIHPCTKQIVARTFLWGDRQHTNHGLRPESSERGRCGAECGASLARVAGKEMSTSQGGFHTQNNASRGHSSLLNIQVRHWSEAVATVFAP